MTTSGVAEFIYYLKEYDPNNPFGENAQQADDAAAAEEGGEEAYNNEEDLPTCAQVNGYYVGLGCASDGTFSLQFFSDQYCLQPSGDTYDKLKTLNKKLKNYKNCVGVYSSNNGDENQLVPSLISVSDSCSSLDSSLCSDNSAMSNRRSHSYSRLSRNRGFGQGKSWLTKLKYVAGGLLLLASFVMFTGILFTNRRRRRALMQRKYRQARREERSRRSKSRSKSKTRSKSRSKSKTRRERPAEGVFT